MFRLLVIYFLVVNKIIITNADASIISYGTVTIGTVTIDTVTIDTATGTVTGTVTTDTGTVTGNLTIDTATGTLTIDTGTGTVTIDTATATVTTVTGTGTGTSGVPRPEFRPEFPTVEETEVHASVHISGCDDTNGNLPSMDACDCGEVGGSECYSSGYYCLEYQQEMTECGHVHCDVRMRRVGYCFGKGASNNIAAWKDAYNTFACSDRQDHPVAQILKSKWENANHC